MADQKRTGIILSYLGQLVTVLTTLVYTPIMLRILGQSEYGLYQLVYSVVAYLSILNLGFNASYIRYYSQIKAEGSEEDIYRLNGMFLAIFMLISLVAMACGCALISGIRGIFNSGLTDSEYETARFLMIFMVINVVISFPDSALTCIITARERFIFHRLVVLIRNVLNPVITIPILMLGYGSRGVVLVATAIAVINVVVDIIYVLFVLKTRFIFTGLRFSLLSNIGVFTFFIFLNQVIDQINWNVDKYLLGRFLGTSVVAVYGIGSLINLMYLHISSAVSAVFVPQVNRLAVDNNHDNELSELFIKIGRIQFMLLGLFLTGFIFFGKAFVCLWGGSNYKDAYYVALLLMIPSTVPLVQNLGIEIQRAKNKHRVRSIVYFCIAIGNVFFSIILIRKIGMMGAPIGTAISLVVGNGLFMNWYYNHVLNINIKLFWKRILSFAPAFAFPVLIGIIIVRLFDINNVLTFLVGVFIYTMIYSLSMFMFGMDKTEKKYVSGMFGFIR